MPPTTYGAWAADKLHRITVGSAGWGVADSTPPTVVPDGPPPSPMVVALIATPGTVREAKGSEDRHDGNVLAMQYTGQHPWRGTAGAGIVTLPVHRATNGAQCKPQQPRRQPTMSTTTINLPFHDDYFPVAITNGYEAVAYIERRSHWTGEARSRLTWASKAAVRTGKPVYLPHGFNVPRATTGPRSARPRCTGDFGYFIVALSDGGLWRVSYRRNFDSWGAAGALRSVTR